jgi:outer membrane receptor protein involved in Fe transport
MTLVRAAVALVLSAVLGLGMAGPYRGRPLVEVLDDLQARGLRLIFSSAVVDQALRVTVEPSSPDPRRILDEILAPLGLEVRDGPGGSLLIVPAGRQEGGVAGRVVSGGGGEAVAGAVVRLLGTEHTTVSVADGSFVFPRVAAGTYDLAVEAPGFWTATVHGVRVAGARASGLTVPLRAQPSLVTDVVVTPSRLSVVQQEQVSVRTVEADDAVLVPTIGGDVSRVVELLPGMASPDNSAAFHARGSHTEDVAIVLDGLELYEPFHLAAFQSPFTVVDGRVVDRIDVVGGGFTADLGDRHGGFVEISTLAPADAPRGGFEVGTLNSEATYRAPLRRGPGSWLVSVRGWYPEVTRDTIGLGGGEKLDPRFADAYGKVSIVPGPRVALSAHGLVVYDRVGFAEEEEEANERADALTRSGHVWLRALRQGAGGRSSETVLGGGRIERSRDGIAAPEDEDLAVDDDRVVRFYGLRHDATWPLSEAHVLRGGVEARRLEAAYRYSRIEADDPTSVTAVALEPEGTSLGAYVSHRARLSRSVATEVGLRWDRQSHTGDAQLSPRLNAVWQPGERTDARLGVGRFSQSQRIHELQVEDGETAFRPAELSQQVDLTVHHRFRNGLRLRVDAYHRRLSRLRPRFENLFESIELFPEAELDRVQVWPQGARLRGIEVLARGDAESPLSWSASYALSSARDLIDGRSVPRSWDQTHALKVLVGYRRDDRWMVSLAATAHTGWPTTPVTGTVVTDPEGEPQFERVLGPRNSDRFPWYLRLDAKARRVIPVARGRLGITLDVVNLTDRKNACCVDNFTFAPGPDGTVDVREDLDHWLGITPSFALSWEF